MNTLWARFRRETVWVVSESPSAPQDAVGLLRRVDPPRLPRRTEIHWPAVESRLGTALPADYRRLIDDRGPGVVADVVVHGPSSPGAALDLVNWLHGIERMVSALRAITYDRVPPPFHPEPGGILPWGLLHDGRIAGWAVTSDDPDAWPVVVLNSELDGFTRYETSATEFLLARVPGPEVRELTIG
ncbi:hypothetical protein [Cryptosporangium japonicum]